jgi:anti-sigma regulatory factor (Ser/Thr protein kinase)
MTTTVTSDAGSDHDRFVHPAWYYRSEQEYLQGLVPFITEGLAAGDPVAAAVPSANLAVLRDALGADAERVRLMDMTEAGRNPGRIIAGVLRAFADAHPDRHVRIIGEPIWPGRSSSEYPACVQHEALINLAFAGRDVTIVCPYDAVRLPPHVLDDAEATHPLLWDTRDRRRSDGYAPEAVIDRYNLPLDGAPAAEVAEVTEVTVTKGEELSRLRRLTADRARRHGLAAGRCEDLEFIVTELVTNSLLHARSTGVVRFWSEEDYLVCQVSDGGRLTDPLAGRRPAAPGQINGLGLLLVNEFADLVRTHVSDDGTTIRVYLHRHSQ